MPETLTADQANQLAAHYSGVADALGKYRSDNWNTLSEAQRERLRVARNKVRNQSTELVKLALQLRLDDLKVTLTRIKQATDKMKTAIQHLHNVEKAIKIATALVTLAGALIAKNPVAIAEAIEGAFTASADEQAAANK
jgi:ABC-type thiamine transport system ATPase subunit